MGKCVDASLVIFRLLVNLAIIAGAGMVLYGMVQSRSNVEDVVGEAQCLLWAKFTTRADGTKYVTSSPDENCRYNIIGASVSIVVALFLSIALIYQLAKGNSHERSCTSWLEMLLVLGVLSMAIAVGVISSGGLNVSCANARQAFQISDCKRFHLCNSLPRCPKSYYVYNHLYIAEVGSWFLAGGWVLQMVCSVRNLCLYRRGQRSQKYDMEGTSDKNKIMESMVEA